MEAVLNVSAQNLNRDFVKNLKSKFGKANFEIRVQVPAEAPTPFLDKDFWEVIDLLDWEKTGDDEAVLAPAIHFLAQKPLEHIYRFADFLSEKLFQLDTRAHAQIFLEKEKHLSVDDFLYVRCCVVANGKTAFEDILSHPEKMPLDFTFESLLHLPNRAFELKTGKKSLLVPAFNYETYSNRNGWKK